MLEETLGEKIYAAVEQVCMASERRLSHMVEGLREEIRDLRRGVFSGDAMPGRDLAEPDLVEMSSSTIPDFAQRSTGAAVDVPRAQQEDAASVILAQVQELMRHDESQQVSLQRSQVMKALGDLTSRLGGCEADSQNMVAGQGERRSRSSDAGDLHSTVKSTSRDLRRLRQQTQQRSSDFSEMVARLESLEHGLLSLNQPDEAQLGGLASNGSSQTMA